MVNRGNRLDDSKMVRQKNQTMGVLRINLAINDVKIIS